MMVRSPLALLVAALLLGATSPTLAQSSPPNPRIALVIGESTYGDKTLATPVNDAALIAQTLQAAGFDVVGARDLDEKSIRTAMRDFLNKAAAIGPDMQAFVYLAGRGVQYEGDNFFVPVDAQIARDSDVPIEAVRIADFAHALASEPGRARILVLDAARATPYPGQGQPLAGGLALVDADPGELVAFNAAPGSIAGDEDGPYGAYAKTLAGAMREGGLPIEDALAQTRVQVNQLTGGAQLPWSVSKLTEPYYVFERAADAPPPPAVAALAESAKRPIRAFPADQAYAAALQRDTLAGYQEFIAAYPNAAEARRVRAILAARREALFWRRAVAQDTPPAYWTYLRRYPRGPHVADAERRLAVLAAAAQPPGDFAPEDYSDLPPPPQDEYVYAERPVYAFDGPDFGPPPPPPPPEYYPVEDDDWRRLPPPAPPVAVGVLPALAVAIPLIIGARAYHDAGRREGRAPRNAPPPTPLAQSTPLPPPPLPSGVKPRPPSPAPTGVQPTSGPTNGVPPGSTPAPNATATSGAGATPTLTPTGGLKPLGPVHTPLVTPTPSPSPTGPQPSGATGAGGGKPLPSLTPLPTASPTGSKPIGPGGKPLPTLTTSPTPSPTGSTPAAGANGKPLPPVTTLPTASPTGSAPAAGGNGKPLPSLTPLPTASPTGSTPAAGANGKPLPSLTTLPTPSPTGTKPLGGAGPTGGKPLPTLTTAPTPSPTGAKPLGGANGKPLPSLTPLPTPGPTGAKPLGGASPTGGKPLPTLTPERELHTPKAGPAPGKTFTPESKPLNGGGAPLPKLTPQRELQTPKPLPTVEKAVPPTPKFTPNAGPVVKPPLEMKPPREPSPPPPQPKVFTPEPKPLAAPNPPPTHLGPPAGAPPPPPHVVAPPPPAPGKPACGKPGEPACPK